MKKQTWPAYFKKCEKLCPHNLSFSVLAMTVPFFQSYERGISANSLMYLIYELSENEGLTIDERQKSIDEFIK